MNAHIEQARNVALDLLKPSQRDVEHGLELHDRALVIESYGLGLSAPLDPEEFNTAVEGGASGDELQAIAGDGLTGWATDAELRREYQDAWRASGVSCTFQNAGEEGNDPMRIFARLARHVFITDSMPEFLQRATTPDDIVAAHAAGKRCLYLTANGVPLVGSQRTVEDELRYIRIAAQLGIRMMHLTYNRRNVIGDGCGEPGNAGLSDFGHAVVKELNRRGILIDLAHTGWQTCLEAAAASESPVIVSHSAAHAVNAHIRCKPDEVIRAVLETGGVMGITNVPAFLGGHGDIRSFLDHIQYVARTFGVDAVCIGTDGSYVSEKMAAADSRIKAHPKRRQRWESLWPPNDPLGSPEWRKESQKQSLTWTNWPLFTVGLVQRGYSDDDILKIVGGNVLRVARQAWSQSMYRDSRSQVD